MVVVASVKKLRGLPVKVRTSNNRKKKGKEARIVDPERPKRPLTAYMHFFLSNRDPSLDFQSQARESGKAWRKMTKAMKTRYVRKAGIGKRIYVKKMKRYVKPTQALLFDRYGHRPMRFLNSWGFFVKDKYKTYASRNPGQGLAKIIRLMSCDWRVMSDKRRKKYNDQMHADMDRWRTETKAYLEGRFATISLDNTKRRGRNNSGRPRCRGTRSKPILNPDRVHMDFLLY